MGANPIRARAARYAVMARLVPDCRCCGKIGGAVAKNQNLPAVWNDQHTPRVRACHLQRTEATLAPPRPWRGSFLFLAAAKPHFNPVCGYVLRVCASGSGVTRVPSIGGRKPTSRSEPTRAGSSPPDSAGRKGACIMSVWWLRKVPGEVGECLRLGLQRNSLSRSL